MRNKIDEQVQYILASITRRYVMTDSKIPPEVLKLKDEVMEIFEKSKHETSPEISRQYEQRLAEIRGLVAPKDREDLRG